MTEVVVSDGIAVLVNYARAKQQEISDASIVCLQCIARADKRYRTAIRALTHDKALDEKIFPGKLRTLALNVHAYLSSSSHCW